LTVILNRRSDVAEGAVAEDGRRTPFLLTRTGRWYTNEASTLKVLRPSYGVPRFALQRLRRLRMTIVRFLHNLCVDGQRDNAMNHSRATFATGMMARIASHGE
jgi:hypothetical protein